MTYPGRTMESRFDELKRYVRFTDDDARRLVAFGPIARPHFSTIATQFYERIREHEEAHAVLTGEEQIVRLQRSLVAWLERLLGGTYDEGYYEQTERIGRIHVKVGLPQHYMFTAMALIRSSLTALAAAAECEPALDPRDALGRLLDLDLAIMLESYRDDMATRLERMAGEERAALGRRLESAERRYVQAVELADAMMIGLSREGAIVLFNKEAERITGYARDEVLGKDLAALVLPAESAAARLESFRSPNGGASRRFELPLRTRAGKIRDIRWHVVDLPATAEDDIESFAVGHDVTEERVKREHAQQQERLAAVGTLAAGLAHEIRNPLNGARLHISFLERTLKQTEATPDTLEAVQIVQDEIKRLARLVTDFLDFARPRPLARMATSVRALCERASQLAAPVAKENVSLELDLPANDVVFDADKDRLEQVLINLLQNAIEALGQKGGKVTLRARRQPRHVWLEVEDDGPGLPPGNAPVFDAFFSTKPHGTGLGLAIAHRVVTDHGGVIDVESRPGRTRFRVSIPLVNEERGA